MHVRSTVPSMGSGFRYHAPHSLLGLIYIVLHLLENLHELLHEDPDINPRIPRISAVRTRIVSDNHLEWARTDSSMATVER